MARLFISQDRIDRWSQQQKVTIDGDLMHLPLFKTTFRLEPAVHFVRLVGGGTGGGSDPNDLIGRVKGERQLREMGADVVATSVVLGDFAYECVDGFIGSVVEEGTDKALRSMHLRQLRQLPDPAVEPT